LLDRCRFQFESEVRFHVRWANILLRSSGFVKGIISEKWGLCEAGTTTASRIKQTPSDASRLASHVSKTTRGKLLRRGEFSPGYPYAYVADPDGYEVEIWYE
jgi:hypothetical protein